MKYILQSGLLKLRNIILIAMLIISPLAYGAESAVNQIDLPKKERALKLPPLTHIDGINKENIAKLDAERRELRKIIEKLISSNKKKNEAIKDLVRVVKLAELENKFNRRIADKSMDYAEKVESKAKWEGIFTKIIQIASMALLLGL